MSAARRFDGRWSVTPSPCRSRNGSASGSRYRDSTIEIAIANSPKARAGRKRVASTARGAGASRSARFQYGGKGRRSPISFAIKGRVCRRGRRADFFCAPSEVRCVSRLAFLMRCGATSFAWKPRRPPARSRPSRRNESREARPEALRAHGACAPARHRAGTGRRLDSEEPRARLSPQRARARGLAGFLQPAKAMGDLRPRLLLASAHRLQTRDHAQGQRSLLARQVHDQPPLRREGFRVVMVWECETREVERLTARLAKALADLAR